MLSGSSFADFVSRMVREYLELEQALVGEKDDNPWSWVRKRLIGVRGYKPWFGHLFTRDQQEMRYRDIHADLRVVREGMEKEAKEKGKDAARSGGGAGGGGGAGASGSSRGKGRSEQKRCAYEDMDAMRRAHLFGVSIKAHVEPRWTRQEDQAGALAHTPGAAGAGGEGGAQGGQKKASRQVIACDPHAPPPPPPPPCVPAHTAAAGAKGCGKKRKAVTAKLREGKLREGDTRRHLQGLQGDTRTRQPKPREPEAKLRETQTGCTPKATRPSPTAKGIRVPKDRAWTRFFSFLGFQGLAANKGAVLVFVCGLC